ncbi:MAG TPA: prepilin-type N-terminal cleavage/methylation domain-containing protein [Planctomycetota bacterium]|nr:prepilin-type N-terminal cleavage/methylation domain-containing protein [Planctomycetota bacterium]
MTKTRRRGNGFTLIELLIVIIIIVLMATMAVALLSVFFRGQGARQGAMVVMQALAQTKQEAAKMHRYHFLVFSKPGEDGWMEIHRDMDNNGIYTGDQNPKTVDPDPTIEDGFIELPRNVTFEYSPQWLAISPSGYCSFNPGFKEVQASTFDKVKNGPSPKPIGDIILRVMNKPFVMCLDLDRASGKIRRDMFLNDEAK